MHPDERGAAREAVILCGGFGTRLHGILVDRPKALAEVLGRPFVEWIVRSLVRTHGVEHIVFATGHKGEMIERYFEGVVLDGVKLSYSRESRPLGTGGALRLALGLTSAPHLLVLNGDTYCRFDLSRLLEIHRRNSAVASLWLAWVRDQGRYGSVKIDRKGRIREFRETDALAGPRLASAGVYLIDRNAAMAIPSGQAVSLEHEVFPALIVNGVYGVIGTSGFVDIGTPESLASADSALTAEHLP